MTPAHFIADLYELNSKLIQPVDYRQIYAEPNITYAVIQTLIATFSDKYKVVPEDVMAILRERQLSIPTKTDKTTEV